MLPFHTDSSRPTWRRIIRNGDSWFSELQILLRGLGLASSFYQDIIPLRQSLHGSQTNGPRWENKANQANAFLDRNSNNQVAYARGETGSNFARDKERERTVTHGLKEGRSVIPHLKRGRPFTPHLERERERTPYTSPKEKEKAVTAHLESETDSLHLTQRKR